MNLVVAVFLALRGILKLRESPTVIAEGRRLSLPLSSYSTTPSLNISEKITSLLKGWSLSPTTRLVGLRHTGWQFIWEDTSVSCCIHRRVAVSDRRLLELGKMVFRKCWPSRAICDFLNSGARTELTGGRSQAWTDLISRSWDWKVNIFPVRTSLQHSHGQNLKAQTLIFLLLLLVDLFWVFSAFPCRDSILVSPSLGSILESSPWSVAGFQGAELAHSYYLQ